MSFRKNDEKCLLHEFQAKIQRRRLHFWVDLKPFRFSYPETSFEPLDTWENWKESSLKLYLVKINKDAKKPFVWPVCHDKQPASSTPTPESIKLHLIWFRQKQWNSNLHIANESSQKGMQHFYHYGLKHCFMDITINKNFKCQFPNT